MSESNATTARPARPPIRVKIHDGSVIRDANAHIEDIPAELQRRNMRALPGIPGDFLTSFEEAGGGDFAVVVKLPACHFLIWLPGVQSYMSFMRQFAPIANVLDRLFL